MKVNYTFTEMKSTVGSGHKCDGEKVTKEKIQKRKEGMKEGTEGEEDIKGVMEEKK